MPLEGTVSIQSKTVNIDSIDIDQTDKNKFKEKLTEGSEVNIRAQRVRVNTINEKGQSVGKFSVHSKKISMKSVDMDGYKDDLEFDEQGNVVHPKLKAAQVTVGSTMTVVSEKMNIGFKNDKMISKELSLGSSEKIEIHSGKLAKLSAGAEKNDNNHVTLSDSEFNAGSVNGNASLSGKNINLSGVTKITGEITAGDIKCANVEASKSVKAPNLSDGMKVPSEQPVAKQATKSEQNDLEKNDDDENT
jgi:hypothetical protein